MKSLRQKGLSFAVVSSLRVAEPVLVSDCLLVVVPQAEEAQYKEMEGQTLKVLLKF